MNRGRTGSDSGLRGEKHASLLRAAAPYITGSPGVPNLNVAGSWDQEDFYGSVNIYQAFEKYDTKHLNYLVVEPWNHGGWRRDGSKLGEIAVQREYGRVLRQHIEARWFAYWLHDQGSLNLADATVFQTGSNRWEKYNSWPPPARSASLYTHSHGKLSFDAPTQDEPESADTYLSDLSHPSPYRSSSDQTDLRGSGLAHLAGKGSTFLRESPRCADLANRAPAGRCDGRCQYLSRIYASTRGIDAEWVVKLIDVYPQGYPENPSLAGYQLMIAADILRGVSAKALGTLRLSHQAVTAYKIDLHTTTTHS